MLPIEFWKSLQIKVSDCKGSDRLFNKL
jgi:hypothetical protein